MSGIIAQMIRRYGCSCRGRSTNPPFDSRLLSRQRLRGCAKSRARANPRLAEWSPSTMPTTSQAFRAQNIESNGSPAVSAPRPGPIPPGPAAVPGAVRRTIPRTVSRTVPRTIPGTVLRSAPGTAARAVSRAVSTAVPAPRPVARTIPRSITGSIPRAISRAIPRAIATSLSVSGGGPPPVPTGGAVVLLVSLPLRHSRCARQRLIKRRCTIRRSTRNG